MIKKKQLHLSISYPIPSATIGNAVVTERVGILGKAMDGITAMVGTDHVTHDEHFYSMIANTVISVGVASTVARGRQRRGEAPIAKFFL